MTDRQLLERTVIDPRIMTGKPVLRGTRLTVKFIVKASDPGTTVDELLSAYDGLTEAAFSRCLSHKIES